MRVPITLEKLMKQMDIFENPSKKSVKDIVIRKEKEQSSEEVQRKKNASCILLSGCIDFGIVYKGRIMRPPSLPLYLS